MKDNEGNDAPLTISRGSGSYLRTYISKQEEDGSQLEIYKRLAKESRPTLPPDGELVIHLTLEGEFDVNFGDLPECIGRAVYSVSVDMARSSPDVSQFQIPPLIIKVASERGGRHVAEEAAMYDHLLCLQGSVIPRCYGYFRRVVNLHDYVVVPWLPNCEFPRSKADLDIFKMPNSHASLNVLLLEGVGKFIPYDLHQPESDQQTLQ